MDIALDDLIKKDREKGKTQNKAKKQNKALKGRRLIRKNPRNQKKQTQNQTRKLNKFNNKNRAGFQNNPNKRAGFNNKPKPNLQQKNQQKKNQQQPQQKKENGNSAKQQKGRTLKVLGLHPDITNEDLYKLFAAEGALEKCMIEQDNFGRNMPSAIVKYHSAEMAQQAMLKLNSQKVMNSVLTVVPYKRNP